MSDTPLTDEVALVTGASSGIGRATATALAAAGADVALAARREERLAAVAEDVEAHGREALVVPTDVTDDAAVAALIDRTVEAFDRLDAVVCNAGLGRDAAVEEMTTEQYRDMMDVNVDGAFFTAREAVPHLRETDGSLVLVASFSGQYPRPHNPVYAATKWWVRGFARSLEASVGVDGIAVTTVNPTEVRTEFGSQDGDSLADRYDEGEVTEPEEVADAVVFAVRQEAPTTVSEIDIYRRDKMSHF
jgi:NADP-dependent 3-hydroxy acid dehydrogenase YdfG